ncbi:hypothetical protein ACLVWU_15695 [Bdellovibrio sp. HCB290]|uniref:hypothetical protein n=1 Tax=Bdellovibrio sp. HCB290 TaxID=3394356 RepID=UPI0039B6C8B6
MRVVGLQRYELEMIEVHLKRTEYENQVAQKSWIYALKKSTKKVSLPRSKWAFMRQQKNQ